MQLDDALAINGVAGYQFSDFEALIILDEDSNFDVALRKGGMPPYQRTSYGPDQEAVMLKMLDLGVARDDDGYYDASEA